MSTREHWTDAQLAAYNACLAGSAPGRLVAVKSDRTLLDRHGNAIGQPKPKSARRSLLPGPREADVLRAVLACLQAHPRVAFCWRSNTGGFKVGPAGAERYVKAGFVGQSDIIGMLTDGRFLACEVKRPGGTLTEDQAAFLGHVTEWGGCALMASSIDDVIAKLGPIGRVA